MIAAGAPVARPTAVPPPRLCIGHSPRALENSDPLGAGVIPPPASLAFAEVNAATTLQGTIGDIAVDDVLRLLESRRQTGVLLVNPSNPLRLVLAEHFDRGVRDPVARLAPKMHLILHCELHRFSSFTASG